MSAAALERPAAAGTGNGGVPARRAVTRWAWRLFRREWRQQLLILALVVVAVAATVVGSAVAANTPLPAGASFGTAQDLATFQAPDPHLSAQLAALRQRFGRVDVIENQTVAVPGSVDTFSLRAQDPHGPFGQPLLALVSGHYPAGPGQVAVTAGVASDFHLAVGRTWREGGIARRVTGIVENPRDLLDQFALVTPGQVTAPTQVTALFDARGVDPATLGRRVVAASSAVPANVLNPETISVAALTLGMLLIALVAVGGFTVLAQRRLRSLGMLASLGATDRQIRMVVRANGVVTGAVGAATGTVLGLAIWFGYRPLLETSAHHVIGVLSLPWPVVAAAVVLAMAATYAAASRPARAITRVPLVAALSGRPAPPKRLHRWAVPAGVVFFLVAFFVLGASGSSLSHGSGMGELVLGLVALTVAVILLAPLCLVALARLGRRAPIAVRLALRDLARYRARSGPALAAVSIGVLIAVVTCVAAAARYSNVLDYVGPNLAPSQLLLRPDSGPGGPGPRVGPGGGGAPAPTASQVRAMATSARGVAAALGTRSVLELDTTPATLLHAATGRNWYGQIYVATPQLLRAFGIGASQVDPAADILTMRPGMATLSKMQLIYGNPYGNRKPGPPQGNPWTTAHPFPCPPGACLAGPKIQEVSALPPGTSAPNTVITEHAVRQLHLQAVPSGWLVQTARPLTAGQISSVRQLAAAANMVAETRTSVPTMGTIINWATAAGIVLALGILAMSAGLLRSETASSLRTLAATGAGSWTRRTLSATTVGGLALVGALLGTAAGYAATIAWFRSNALDGLSSLANVPVQNLLIILVGMPLVAAAAAWLLAGREPAAVARRPLE